MKIIAHLHLWDAAKAVLAGKILALNGYIGGKSYQINNPRNQAKKNKIKTKLKKCHGSIAITMLAPIKIPFKEYLQYQAFCEV